MPPGIPVATVGTDAGDNAAILAVQILGVSDESAQASLEKYKSQMKEKVLCDDAELNNK